MTRRQFSSCDRCRQSKRRCEPAPQETAAATQRNTCGNCRRLHLNCTYNFASTKWDTLEIRRRGKDVRRRPSILQSSTCASQLSGVVYGGDHFTGFEHMGGAGGDGLAEPLSDQFGLSAWKRWNNEFLLDGNNPLLFNEAPPEPITDIGLVGDALGSSFSQFQSDFGLQALRSPRRDNSIEYFSNISPSSPLRMLNLSFESRLLDDKLYRVYKHIGFLSVSTFLGKGCNPFTEQEIDLEKGETADWRHISADSDPWSSPPSMSNPASSDSQGILRLTMMGAAAFLDHFAALYGNELDKLDCQLAQIALNDVYRAFCSQWVQKRGDSATNHGAPPTTMSDYTVDCWCKARYSVLQAQRVRSFKTVWAMLLFNMTTVPPQFAGSDEVQVKKDFLRDCISQLTALRQLVLPYCETLGQDSIYAKVLHTCMSPFSWLAIMRDSTISIMRLKPPILKSISFEPRGDKLVDSSSFPSPNMVLHLDDTSILNFCRSAVTEMMFSWRWIYPYVLGNSGEENANNLSTGATCNDPLNNFNIVASAIDRYEMKYHELMRHCLFNHAQLSARTKFLSAIWIIIWNSWLLTYADALEKLIGDTTSTIFTSKIQQFRWTAAQTIAAISIKGLLGSLSPSSPAIALSSDPSASSSFSSPPDAPSPDDVWDDDYSVPIISSHATSSIIVNAIKKASESLIEMRLKSEISPTTTGIHGPFMGFGIDRDPLQEWSRTLCSLLECLATLQKVACTAQLATVTFQGLMQRNGDLISEHWVGLY